MVVVGGRGCVHVQIYLKCTSCPPLSLSFLRTQGHTDLKTKQTTTTKQQTNKNKENKQTNRNKKQNKKKAAAAAATTSHSESKCLSALPDLFQCKIMIQYKVNENINKPFHTRTQEHIYTTVKTTVCLHCRGARGRLARGGGLRRVSNGCRRPTTTWTTWGPSFSSCPRSRVASCLQPHHRPPR